MKFDVRNRFTGAVQFTAEIDCDDSAHTSINLGLAVRWAVKSGASLDGAILNGAILNGASLDGASLDGASLDGAILNGASLDGASLNGASLNGASLNGASLDGAILNGASLDGASGINDWIKCIQIDTWPIAYTHDTMQIGCQRHLISEWAAFDDDTIRRMDDEALEFWAKYEAWILQTIELCPARPPRAETPADAAPATA